MWLAPLSRLTVSSVRGCLCGQLELVMRSSSSTAARGSLSNLLTNSGEASSGLYPGFKLGVKLCVKVRRMSCSELSLQLEY